MKEGKERKGEDYRVFVPKRSRNGEKVGEEKKKEKLRLARSLAQKGSSSVLRRRTQGIPVSGFHTSLCPFFPQYSSNHS